MRIRLQLCVGLVLIAMLGAARAEGAPAGAGASSGSLLEPSRTLILLNYQKVDVQGDAPIDLMGAHLFRQVNDWLLLGVGEDVSFCLRAQAAGHVPHVDLGLRCGHVGNYVY